MSQVAEYIEPDSPTTAVRPHQPQNAVSIMDMIGQAVAAGNMDMVERLMVMQERWEANNARKAFDEAMASAKAEIPVIFKNREVDFSSSKGRTHYRHEDLAEIARTVNPILGKHGLSYRFRTSSNLNEPITVTCVVTHRLGYFEENTLVGPRDDSGNKNSHQQIGSALTYLQRMTLKAALGLAAASDDDSRAAGRLANVELAGAEDIEAIRVKIMAVGTNEATICERIGIQSLDDLPASKVESVNSGLMEYARRRAANQSEASHG